MKKVMVVLGTRPEVIKLASFITLLKKEEEIETIIVNSGQHLDMTNKMLQVFRINPNYELKIMEANQSLSKSLKNVLVKLTPVVVKEKPDVIVVLGDTNTSLGAAIVAYHNQIPIFHIEGGVRSYNKYDAFPEEGNRTIIDHLADWNTCQTELDVERLEKEGISNGVFTGNNSLDVIKTFVNEVSIDKQVLITMHRREGWGEPMMEACEAIKTLASNFPDHKFIIARHPNPIVYSMFTETLKDLDNVMLLDNLPFDEFVRLMARSKLVMTDSGGMIQESIFLRKPVINLRDKSEYEDFFDGVFLVSAGKDKNKIVTKASHILMLDKPVCDKIDVFGNGNSGKECFYYLCRAIRINKCDNCKKSRPELREWSPDGTFYWCNEACRESYKNKGFVWRGFGELKKVDYND